MNLLKISHTYKPCGTKIHYPFGMSPAPLKNLGPAMKNAAFEAVQGQTKVNRKLKKVA